MKQVRETAAGKSISAWVILNPEGQHIATVQSHYSNGRTCTVDVWGKSTLIHQGKAGGYGYDKFTAALSGAVIDGIKIYNHCCTDSESENLLKMYHDAVELGSMLGQESASKAAKQLGAQFANYGHGPKGSAMSLYYIDGLDRLSAMGYKVIQAI